jgi:hypothetical protein
MSFRGPDIETRFIHQVEAERKVIAGSGLGGSSLGR